VLAVERLEFVDVFLGELHGFSIADGRGRTTRVQMSYRTKSPLLEQG
jgi:hypothetical protein